MAPAAGADAAPGPKEVLLEAVLRLGDNALVLGQRLSQWVGQGPTLEEEMALANLALDLVGEARMFLAYAGEIEGAGRDEDALAFLRDDRALRNLNLLEQPNGDFGDTIVRQVLFEAWHVELLAALSGCRDHRVAEISQRCVKEARYHLRHAGHWLVRLGDGTQESHARVSASLVRLWPLTAEMFTGDGQDSAFQQHFEGPDLGELEARSRASLAPLFAEAKLELPAAAAPNIAQGKQGVHSEHLGYLLAEMQHLHRSHPGASW
ncbi:MAG: 1,2-phenylacetyl-CoA epoxidase subunit PaaC [Pseudomonadota bacterium]